LKNTVHGYCLYDYTLSLYQLPLDSSHNADNMQLCCISSLWISHAFLLNALQGDELTFLLAEIVFQIWEWPRGSHFFLSTTSSAWAINLHSASGSATSSY